MRSALLVMRPALLLALLLVAPARAAEPALHSLNPASGPVAEDVAVLLAGGDLPPDSRLALLAGGPRRLAGISLEGSSRAYGIDLDGDRAVVAFFESAPFKSGGFEVFDVSDPRRPVSIERFAVVDITGLGAVAAGDEVFSIDFNIYTFDGSLRCVDLSVPGAPRQVAVQYFPQIPNKVALVGEAVAVTHSGGVFLFDRAHPSEPPLALETPGPAWQAVLHRGRLYATYSSGAAGGLRVWADEGRGGLVADLPLPQPAYGLDASDELVAVTLAGPNGGELRTFSTAGSAPLAPLGRLSLPGFATHLSLRGERALASMGSDGLALVDLGDPSAPQLLGSYSDLGFSAWEAELDGNGYAQVADFGLGLTVVDLRHPRPPAPLASVPAAGPARSVAVDDGLAAVALGAGGIELFELSQPDSPASVGRISLPGGAEGLRLREGLAYVASGRSGLAIVDVSDPANPEPLGAADTPGTAYGVALDGAHTLVADGTRGLSIVDARDPADPRLLATLRTGGPVRDVSARGGFAYLAAGYRGLQVVDLAEPADPRLVTSIRSCGSLPISSARATALLGGDLLLVASSAQGVAAFRLDDPAAPVCIGLTLTPGRALDIAAATSGRRAFVADDRQGLAIIDYSDEQRPMLTESLPLAGPADGVASSGDLAAVAAGDAGLVLVRPNPALRETRWLAPDRIAATVPAGLAPGPYDLHLVTGSGEAAWLRNGWVACAASELDSQLVAAPPPPGGLVLPLAWRPVSAERIDSARVLLPQLEQPLIEELIVPHGTERIEVFPVERGFPARLRLIGPVPGALLDVWSTWQQSGGVPFPLSAEGEILPLRLAVAVAAGGAMPPTSSTRGAISRSTEGTAYRFELTDGRLVAATASGPGADFAVAVEARLDSGCRATGIEMLSEAQAALCRDPAPEWLRRLCAMR